MISEYKISEKMLFKTNKTDLLSLFNHIFMRF